MRESLLVKILVRNNLTQTYGDHGLRFAGPNLLDYFMIFEIHCGPYDGERLKIESAYHPCCGTLEVNASLFGVYKRWRNKMGGCQQQRRDGGGDIVIRNIVWNLLDSQYQ
jgi:hypothetical protein